MTLEEYLAAGFKKYYAPGSDLPDPPMGYTWKAMTLNGVTMQFKLWEIDKRNCGCH